MVLNPPSDFIDIDDNTGWTQDQLGWAESVL